MTGLFPLPATDERTLKPLQRDALEYLRDHPGGLTAQVLAPLLALHPEYGPQQARRILVSLKAAGHVSQHRHGVWKARRGVRDGKHDPASAPFPPGF